MNKLLIAAATLLLGFSSCSKEENFDGAQPVPSAGTRVSLTLKGSAGIPQPDTRANGADGDVKEQLAARNEEKSVNSMLAVAFYKFDAAESGITAGTLYKVFPVENLNSSDGTLPSFDMALEGRFDVWFVANAETTLAEKIKALAPKTATEAKLQELIAEQAPDVDNKFLMVSTQPYDISTVTGATTSISVVMRRAAVRIDIINRVPDVTIKSVKFINRAMKSRIATPNTEDEAPKVYTSDKVYGMDANGLGATGLVGYLPPKEGDPDAGKLAASKCEAKIYSYENLNDDAANHISTLELTYIIKNVNTPGGQPIEKKYTVEFKALVSSSTKVEQLQLKRNHLYRVILNEKHSDEHVWAEIVVDDWNTATAAFEVNDTPFDPSVNKALFVNRFSPYNAKNVDLDKKTFDFNSLFDNRPEIDKETSWDKIKALKEYFNFTELKTAKIIGEAIPPVFTGNDKKFYRMPTKGELELLAPMGDHKISFDATALVKATGTETICLQNNADGTEKTDGDKVQGEFEFRKATTAKTLLDGTTKVYPVYGIRFKGSEQESAYCWEYCDMPESKSGDKECYLSIKIKAIKKMALAEKAMDKVAADEFWADGFIEFKFPCTGAFSTKDSKLLNRGTASIFCGSTIKDNSLYLFGGDNTKLDVTQETTGQPNELYVPIRFVTATETEHKAWEDSQQAPPATF